MKNKILLFSFFIIVVSLLGNTALRSFNSIRVRERKCDLYKPMRFDITFSHRQQCLQSVKANQNEGKNYVNMETVEEIQTRGYNASTHTVLSKDGYYTTMYRISGGKRSPPKHGKRAVLIFHGFSGAGKNWIIQPGNRNLAFTLADTGYEVWLANMRGSTASQNHTHFNADKDFDYWDFGIAQVGTLDLPLMINLILQETGTNQIYYVCHSGGCGVLLSGLLDIPELSSKIKAAFLLAPGIFLGTGYSPVFFPPILERPWEQLLYRVFGGKITDLLNALSTTVGLPSEQICEWPLIRCGFCDNYFFAMFGADPEQMDYGNLPNIMKKMRDTGAVTILRHAKQLHETCEFQRYDFGKTRNLLEYGSANPPLYNLSQIAVPIYIFYGEGDNFLTPLDMEKLRDALPTKYMKGFYKVDWHKFNHIDFIMAKDADVLLYHRIRDTMREIE